MIELGLRISFLPLNPLSREVEWCSLALVQLQEEHRITLPMGVMVRKARSYGVIVNAFLELLRELYPKSAILSPMS
jgi:hypothetical protein